MLKEKGYDKNRRKRGIRLNLNFQRMGKLKNSLNLELDLLSNLEISSIPTDKSSFRKESIFTDIFMFD